MPFVQVKRGRVEPEGPEQPKTADAEDRVLRQAELRVAHIEAPGDPPVQDVVLGASRVEEVQGHAPHVHAPRLHDHVAAPHRNRDRHRLAVLTGDERHRQRRVIDLGPVVVLPAGGVQALVVAALPVQQAQPHHGEPPVGGLLQDVPGQDPEPARVDGDRHVQPVLEAEERDGPFLPGRRHEPAESPIQLLHSLHEPAVARGARDGRGGGFAEQPHRVLVGGLEAFGVDASEQLRSVGGPRPPHVERQPGQRRQDRREPHRELIGRARDVVGSVSRHDGSILSGGSPRSVLALLDEMIALGCKVLARSNPECLPLP